MKSIVEYCKLQLQWLLRGGGAANMSSESSAESDIEHLELFTEELQNIQLVKDVTRSNIDALNAKFATLQEPPPMYLTGGHTHIYTLSISLSLSHTHTHSHLSCTCVIHRIPRVDLQTA